MDCGRLCFPVLYPINCSRTVFRISVGPKGELKRTLAPNKMAWLLAIAESPGCISLSTFFPLSVGSCWGSRCSRVFLVGWAATVFLPPTGFSSLVRTECSGHDSGWSWDTSTIFSYVCAEWH